jgi:C4-dicarboxylate transporter, DctQ subunit
LKRFYEVILRLEDWFVIIGIVLTMLITFGNVFARYFFKVGAGWSEESVRFIMIWVTFVGMDIGIRTHKHVAIDYFVNHLGPGKRNPVNCAVNIVSMLFCVFLFVSSLILTLKVFRLEQISAGLQIPMGYIYTILPVTTLGSAIRYAAIAWKGEEFAPIDLEGR